MRDARDDYIQNPSETKMEEAYDKLAPTPATDSRVVDQIKYDIRRFNDLNFPRDLGGLEKFLKTKSTREKIKFLGSLVTERSFEFKYRLEII